MKRFILSILLGFLFVGAWAQDSYYYGFCDKDLARGEIQSLSAGKSNIKFYCFIHLSAEDATLLAGNKISAIYFSLGYCSATSVNVMICDSIGKTPLYTQAGACAMLKWNNVNLAEPYTIEAGKAVYIGYEVNEKYTFDAPVDVVKDNTYGNTEGDLIGMGSSLADASWSHSSQNGYGNLCLLAMIEGDNLPRNNVALTSLGLSSLGNYVKTGKEFGVTCELKNLGLDRVTTCNVEYTLDDNAPVSFDETLALAHDSICTFTIPSLKVDAEGSHTISVNIKSVNGVEDESPSDNSLSYSFQAYDNVADRTVLVEMFTSQSCKNCDLGDEAVERAISGKSNVVFVAHHSGFANDNYTSDWDANYTWFFPSSGSFNPGVMFDRRNIDAVTLQSDDAPIVFPYTNRCKDYLEYALTFPTFTTVSIEPNYNSTTRELNVNVKTEGFEANETADNLRLNVWLVEDGLVGTQATDESYDYNFVHNGVMRQTLTDVWGEEVQLNGEHTYSCTVPETLVEGNVRIVAFLTNYDSEDNNNCVVLNAAQSTLTGDVSGIREVNASNIYNKVYNLNGQEITQPRSGVYIVNGKAKIYK